MKFQESAGKEGKTASEPTREAQALLAWADSQWKAQGGAAGWSAAIRSCDAALALLGGRESARELCARVWLKRGQILESRRTPEFCVLAAHSHEAGLAALGVDVDGGEGRREGEDGGGETRSEERRTLTALLWMNRGNALLAGGGREAAEEAIRSYERACRLLDAAVADAGGAELWAMAGAAWLNRAAASHAVRESRPAGEDAGCLATAIALLSRAAAAGHAAARRNLAGAWLNRGFWHEAEGAVGAASAAWREAVRAAEPEARRDAVALEAGLQARKALCAALARKREKESAPSAEDTAEMFELVEAGLSDHAAWDVPPAATHEPAARLFEFGAWLHRAIAPGRLAVFLGRHTRREEPRRLEAARVALQMARQEILAAGFPELLSATGREARARLQELDALEKKLAADEDACRQRADTR